MTINRLGGLPRIARQSNRYSSIAALLIALTIATSAQASSFTNLGFEQGTDGLDGWTVVSGAQSVHVISLPGDQDPFYQDGLGLVPVITGQQMIRLAEPKQSSESQNQGAITLLTGEFTAVAGTLDVAVRLFTFEFRGNDRLIIEVLGDPTAEIVSESGDVFDIGAGSCDEGIAATCTIEIDVGGRNSKAAFDSTERTIRIRNLAGTGTPIQLRYTLLPSDNEAHPTWVYFDNLNTPPQPVAVIGPGDPSIQDASGPSAFALEGDFVVADCKDAINPSTDPEGDNITCNWQAWGGGLNGVVSQDDTQVALFWFPDNSPQPTIQLTVSDGLAETVGEPIYVNLVNAEPVVGAVDLEVLEGTSGTTVCRFLDAGIGTYGPGGVLTASELGDGATVTVGSLTLGGKQAEHDAEFSSGFATGICEAGGCSTGSQLCTVTDKDGGEGSDEFTVTVKTTAELMARFEPNNTTLEVDGCLAEPGSEGCGASAAALNAGANYLAQLETPDDVDVYAIRDKLGNKFVANSEVLLTLDVPTDYELMILAKVEDGREASPFYNSTRRSAPFYNSTMRSAPFYNSTRRSAPFYNTTRRSAPFYNTAQGGLAAAPFYNTTRRSSAFTNAPYVDNAPVSSPFYNSTARVSGLFFDSERLPFDSFPLSKVGLAVPNADAMLSSDIDATDPGSLNIGVLQAEPDLQIVDFSADVGDQSEHVMFKVDPGVTEYYAVVFSTNGAFATAPYSLRVEASKPALQADLLGETQYCAPDETFASTHGAPGLGATPTGATIIVTQKERFQLVNPAVAGETEWNNFEAALLAKFAGAALVSVPGAWYADLDGDGDISDGADNNPCAVITRNNLLQKIKDTYIVDPATGEFYSSELANIVVLGDRSVIPAYGVIDTNMVGNERDFALDIEAVPGSWPAVAVAEGYNSTYAFLGDKQPLPLQGGDLWLEDKPVAVLVGAPDTILAELGGIGSTTNSYVFGYEAFADGAQNNADILGSSSEFVDFPDGPTPWWNAADIGNVYNDAESESCLAPIGVMNVYAHMTPGLLWTAEGYRNGDLTDVLTASPTTTNAEGDPITLGKNCLTGDTTTFSMGCHSGMEMALNHALPPIDGESDPSVDWVDELGTYIAPIGYGLGDLFVADRVTEGLLTDVIELAVNGLPLGEAVVQAKRAYALRVPDFDNYDADALINLTLYGDPNKMLAGGGASLIQGTQSALTTQQSLALEDGLSLELTIYEDGDLQFIESRDYNALSLSGFGDYYTLPAPGGAFGAYNRPLLPVTYAFENREVMVTGLTEQPFNDVVLVNRDASQSPSCPAGDGTLTRPCRIAATFKDFPDNDPVFPFPQTNWSAPPEGLEGDFGQDEMDACMPNFGPFPLAFTSSLDNFQSHIVRGAQYRCTTPSVVNPNEPGPGESRGDLRLFQKLHLDALRANVDGTPNNAVDFDPPQVTAQEFQANPDTNEVLARITATDEGFGDSGICEIVVLVYHENLDGEGNGIVESYSSRYDIGPLPADLDNIEVEFALAQARDRRLAAEAIDCDGNIAFKTLKGGLLVALDVQVLNTFIDIGSPTEIRILVDNFGSLEFPTLELEICADASTCETSFFVLQEPLAEGVSIDYVAPADDPGLNCSVAANIPLCDAVVTVSVEEAVLQPPPSQVTATIRSQTTFGTDTATLNTCSDPLRDTNFVDGDIQSCGFTADAENVSFDLILAADPPDYSGFINADVQYRLLLPQYSAQFKYFKGTEPGVNGKKSSPPGVQVQVASITNANGVVGVTFTVSRDGLERLGWTGEPIQFQLTTQSGVPGAPNEGFPDETIIYTGVP